MQPSGNYIFVDDNPGEGINSYRVKVIGRRSLAYSNISTLNQGIKNLQIYPNPVKNKLNISFGGSVGNYKLQIVNISGQVMYQEELKRITGQFILSRKNNMKPGFYLVKLINIDGSVTVQKILFE